MSGVFVTGTDTGCGKTWVSAALLRAAAAAGFSVAGMKPVATGAVREAGRLVNEDVAALAQATTIDAAPALLNPYLFEPPCSPHIAARAAGQAIEFERIEQACQALLAQADVVVVEGVGGWLVPLGEQGTVADLAVRLRLPVVLVVGVRLGAINHAALTAAALAASGVTLAGWVANVLEDELFARDEVIETVADVLGGPPLATLFRNQTHPLAAAARILFDTAGGGGTARG